MLNESFGFIKLGHSEFEQGYQSAATLFCINYLLSRCFSVQFVGQGTVELRLISKCVAVLRVIEATKSSVHLACFVSFLKKDCDLSTKLRQMRSLTAQLFGSFVV